MKNSLGKLVSEESKKNEPQPSDRNQAANEVEKVASKALEHTVWKRIKSRIGALASSGALSSDNHDNVRQIIKKVFDEYARPDATDEERDTAYQSLAEILILSGIAQPSTLSDWSVDRVGEAEDSLGIISFQDLEKTVGEWIAESRDTNTPEGTKRFRHLHLGPGDGRLMYYLRKGRMDRESPRPSDADRQKDTMFVGTNLEKPRTEYWQEIGLGDRLYFSLERLLVKFIRQDKKDDPQTQAIVRVLSMGLQHALRAHWFTEVQETEMMAPKLVSKKPVDLNDIIAFLAKPDSWITDDTNLFARGQCLASREFEKDSVIGLEVGSDEWLLQYVGWEHKKIHKAVRNRKVAFLKIGLQEIHSLRTEMNTLPYPEGEYREKVTCIIKKFRLNVIVPDSEEEVKRALKEGEKEIQQKRDLFKKKRGTMDSHFPNDEDKSRSPIDCLSDYFDERFMAGLRQHEVYADPQYRKKGHPIDLNKAGPEMYMHNFVPGRFQEVRKIFPQGSVTITTAERADSHLSDTEYEQLMVDKLALLEEGGVELSDGVRQSGSRVYRLREIQSAIHKSEGEFQCEVVMNGTTHEPVSVLIQKKLPNDNNNGWLLKDKKMKFIKPSHYLVPLSDVIERRPDLEILNSLRGRIIDLANGNLTIFQQLHGALIKSLNTRLIQASTARNAEFYKVINAELVEEIRTALLGKSNESLGTRLGTELPFDEKLEGATFFDLRTKLMEQFLARKEGRYRRIYDEVIRGILSRILHSITKNAAPDASMTGEEQAGFDEEILAQGKNIHFVGSSYSEAPVLTPRDIQHVMDEVGNDIRALVITRPERTTKITVISGLESLKPEHIHTLPRRGSAESNHNRHTEMRFSSMPKNESFITHEAQQRQVRKRTKVREYLGELKGKRNHPPITLITFADCGTNVCLEERLREIVGEDSDGLMYNLNIAFDLKAEDPLKRIEHLEGGKIKTLERRLQEVRGGIFIIGGSWFDADDEFGAFYKEHVGNLIMDAMKEKHSHHRMISICFGEQTTADLIGQNYEMQHIQTMPGAMEFFPGPIQIIERDHPLFRDFPARITLMQTHSGHVLGFERSYDKNIIRPIARSSITGQVTAFDALDGRILGLQPHPEIRVMNAYDRELLMRELRVFDPSLERQFGAKAEFFNTMWANAAKNVEGEAGYELLLNGLLHHTCALLGRPNK